jgi:tetratricopeptide (TPR) repeat protein
MNAVISGTAGRALLVDGDSLSSFDAGDPSKLVVRQQSDLPFLFGEGRDLRVIEGADLDSIAKELKSEADLNLALDLALVSLDEELEEDIRKDAIQDLDELLVENQLVARLENILYARPLPDDGDLVGTLKLCADSHSPNALSLLQRFEKHQSVIAQVSAAWNSIPTKSFGSYELRADFQHVGVREGLFRALVLALAKPTEIPMPEPQTGIQAKLSSFFLNASLNSSVQGLRNHRQIMQSWTNSFRLHGDAVTIKHEIEEEERETAPRRRHGRRIDIDRPAVLRKVNKKKEIILEAMKRSDLGLVRHLVDDIVGYQLTSGETEHLAKSLCDLAMEAKELGMFSLQLELTERSISVAPSDGWSWAQHGAALLNMQNLDEALRAYDQADAFGVGAVARNGRAEVLKTKGDLDAALAAYDEVISEHPENVFAKTGRAEVFKAKGELDAALAAYNEVISEHPEDAVAKTGRADVLKAKGELDTALAAYNEVISQHPEDAVAKNGRAEVLKTKGELDAALAAYDEVISQHPEDAVARNGRADVLKTKGDLNGALAAYETIINERPENRVARTGRVSILAATERYEEALLFLPAMNPLTLDDWIDYHILGMIRLRTGKMAEAIRIFTEGMKSDPSPSSREYFSRALGLAWLRGRDFQKAADALEAVKSPLLQPAANVLRIHAFGAQGNIQRASVAYENLSAAPQLHSDELTQELHHQFILRRPPRKNEEWIVYREAQILILAA